MKKSKQIPRFRHELKYIITEAEKTAVIEKLRPFIQADRHAKDGQYMIRSLYFDDMWNRAYEEKMSGVAARKKYRIRIYNYEDKMIKLECKNKQGAYIYKEAASLTREETEAIIRGEYDFLQKKEGGLYQRFYYECRTNGMRPKVIVDYDREPFVMDTGEVRITFDKEVRAGMLGFDIFDRNIPTMSCMEPGTLVMEVKFTEFLPQLVRNILPPDHSEFSAVSKYVLCYEKRYGIV